MSAVAELITGLSWDLLFGIDLPNFDFFTFDFTETFNEIESRRGFRIGRIGRRGLRGDGDNTLLFQIIIGVICGITGLLALFAPKFFAAMPQTESLNVVSIAMIVFCFAFQIFPENIRPIIIRVTGVLFLIGGTWGVVALGQNKQPTPEEQLIAALNEAIAEEEANAAASGETAPAEQGADAFSQPSSNDPFGQPSIDPFNQSAPAAPAPTPLPPLTAVKPLVDQARLAWSNRDFQGSLNHALSARAILVGHLGPGHPEVARIDQMINAAKQQANAASGGQ